MNKSNACIGLQTVISLPRWIREGKAVLARQKVPVACWALPPRHISCDSFPREKMPCCTANEKVRPTWKKLVRCDLAWTMFHIGLTFCSLAWLFKKSGQREKVRQMMRRPSFFICRATRHFPSSKRTPGKMPGAVIMPWHGTIKRRTQRMRCHAPTHACTQMRRAHSTDCSWAPFVDEG